MNTEALIAEALKSLNYAEQGDNLILENATIAMAKAMIAIAQELKKANDIRVLGPDPEYK